MMATGSGPGLNLPPFGSGPGITPGRPHTPTRFENILRHYGWVHVFPAEGLLEKIGVYTMMYDEPKVTGGVGGWEQVERRRRRSLTEFAGGPGYTMVLPLIFDNWKDGQASVEEDRKKLESYGTVAKGDREPPLLIVDGFHAIPHDFRQSPSIRWVLDQLEPQPGALWNRYGHMCRYLVQATFLQYIDEGITLKESPAKKKGKHKTKFYVLKKGDTLQKIAKKLHVKGGWKAIAKLNHIRDPHHPGKVGHRIKIPA